MTGSTNTDNYLSAVLEIEWQGSRWIGRPLDSPFTPSDDLPQPEFLNIESVVITAWNPNGEACSADENARRNLLLRDDLKEARIEFFECLGRDESGQHFEESFLTRCYYSHQTQAVLDLARKYCQEAVFLIHGETRVLRFIGPEEKESRQVLQWEEA